MGASAALEPKQKRNDLLRADQHLGHLLSPRALLEIFPAFSYEFDAKTLIDQLRSITQNFERENVATRAQRRQATQNRIKAMSHPLRAEAFKLIRELGPLSPREVARELEADLKDVSYHVRKLSEFQCVEEVANRQVRGAVEHFYRATEQHMIDTEEWAELAEVEPQMAEALTDEGMQGIVDDYTASRRAGVVPLDEEFWIVRSLPLLDPEGVREALEASEEYENTITEIAARSAERRRTEGTEEVPASSSIVFFKMPKRRRRQR
jgi:predicted transcriptional regulator